MTLCYDLNDARSSCVKVRKTSLYDGSKLGRNVVNLRRRKASVVEDGLYE